MKQRKPQVSPERSGPPMSVEPPAMSVEPPAPGPVPDAKASEAGGTPVLDAAAKAYTPVDPGPERGDRPKRDRGRDSGSSSRHREPAEPDEQPRRAIPDPVVVDTSAGGTREQLLEEARRWSPEDQRAADLASARRWSPEDWRAMTLVAARAYGPEREREVQLLLARADQLERPAEEREAFRAEAMRLHHAYSDEERRALGNMVLYQRDAAREGVTVFEGIGPGVVHRVQTDRAERFGIEPPPR